jgi:hypothetical protein
LAKLGDHLVHLAHSLGGEHGGGLVPQPLKEARNLEHAEERHEKNHKGKERAEHLLGEGRRIGGHVIREEVGDGALEHGTRS